MDKSLDEMITERQSQRSSYRGRRNDNRRTEYPRDGIKKTQRDDPRHLDKAWIHDRYEDDNSSRRQPRERRDRDRIVDTYLPDDDRSSYDAPAKLRIDNLHYDLTASDLRELFTRIGHIVECEILYDRSDRSRGIAFVTYSSIRDAKRAIREFDGANAYGQPIQLTLMPAGPYRGGVVSDHGGRGVVAAPSSNTGRSLFDRIDSDTNTRRHGGRRDASPRNRNQADRRADPDRSAGVDRYVPGGGDSKAGPRRTRSPRDNGTAPRRNGVGAGTGRRPGARREGGGGREGDGGHRMVGGRPRKTAEELDAEMEDYWGGDSTEQDGKTSNNTGYSTTNGGLAAPGGFGENSGSVSSSVPVSAPVTAAATTGAGDGAGAGDGDIDMIQ